MNTQTTQTVAEQVVEIIVKQEICPREHIVPEAEFLTDLGFDSIDIAEFLMNVEEAFDIHIPDIEADTIKTVQQATAQIEKALQ